MHNRAVEKAGPDVDFSVTPQCSLSLGGVLLAAREPQRLRRKRRSRAQPNKRRETVGFAVRCEAMALPRREMRFDALGCAPRSGLALQRHRVIGAFRSKTGPQAWPELPVHFTARHSHRFTSGSKAA